MELRQLRYWCVLAEELHFGRAAARLRIATPTLSQQIAALERSVQQTLLHRTSHSVALTRAGEALFAEARVVLAAADRARAALHEAAAVSDSLLVRVATGLAPFLKQEFPALEQHPALDVDLAVTHGLDAELAVLHGRADAAFVWLRANQDPALRSRVVARSEVLLALSRTHRLAQEEVVPVRELAHETIGLFRRHLAPGVYDLFRNHLLPQPDARPEQILTTRARLTPLEGILDRIARGEAVSPFVGVVAQDVMSLEQDGIALRPLDPPLELPVELLWRDPARPRLRAFVDELALMAAG